MSNFQLKKKAVELINSYLGLKATQKDIILFEATYDDKKIKYLFFGISNKNVSFAYKNGIYNSFCMYPNSNGLDGMQFSWIEESVV